MPLCVAISAIPSHKAITGNICNINSKLVLVLFKIVSFKAITSPNIKL